MILIDTSSWIHLLRPNGDPTASSCVEAALQAGEACWCPVVQLELWNGASGDYENRVLRNFSAVLPELPVDEDVWNAAYDIARHARTLGVTVPAINLVIAACAHIHGANIESAHDHCQLLQCVTERMRTTR